MHPGLADDECVVCALRAAGIYTNTGGVSEHVDGACAAEVVVALDKGEVFLYLEEQRMKMHG